MIPHRSVIFGFLLCFSLGCSTLRYQSAKPDTITISAGLPADSAMVAYLNPYKKQIDSLMARVIGECDKNMPNKDFSPEMLLGNFSADLLQIEAQKVWTGKDSIDVAISNIGGLRIPLAPGPITVGTMYELMPFENLLVVLVMPGSELKKLFDKHLQSYGFSYSNSKAYIRRGMMVEIWVGDKLLDPNKLYRVATSDYVANENPVQSVERIEMGIPIRDIMINHVEWLTKQGLKVTAQIEGRVVIEE